MTIIQADITDSEVLTDITMRSKAVWGYSKEQMTQWSDQLTISKPYIETNVVFKLQIGDRIVGYYSYFFVDEITVKLDNLFILPECIGNGIGKYLIEDFLDRVRKTEAKKVVLDSEPNAEKFYSKFGFRKVGQIETSIKNRYLPVMELQLSP